MNIADRLLKLAGIATRAEEAREELRLTKEAFITLRARLIEAWQNTDPRDDKGREKLWLATTQLAQVEKMLRGVVTSGQIAAKEMEALKRAGEPRGAFKRKEQ